MGTAKRDSVALTQSVSGAGHDGSADGGSGATLLRISISMKWFQPITWCAQINAVLDLGWIHQELAPFYSHTG
jgi:hypothetical protein